MMIEDMIRDEKLQYQVLRHRGGWGVGADGAIAPPPPPPPPPPPFFLHGKLKEEK